MRRFSVRLTRDASRDLEAIYDYIAAHDSPVKASRVLDRLVEGIGSLESSPERGSHPHELLALGIRDYRQVVVKPFRVTCWVAGATVNILLIADSRRDMQSLLARRLLGA